MKAEKRVRNNSKEIKRENNKMQNVKDISRAMDN